MIVDSCVDEKAAVDMFRKSEEYLNNQEEHTLEPLPESTVITKPIVHRKSRRSTKRVNDQQSWSKTNSTKSLMHRSNIKELIKHGNLTEIEEIVIQGFGDRLIGETSSAPLVQEFLDRVPELIEQITEIHKAAAKGNVEEFKCLLDRKGIILARDQIGATPLHKSVLYGHQELTDYIANNFPLTLDVRDHEGRTPLHYAAVLDDDCVIYNILLKAGASALLPDYRGKSAEYYQKYAEQFNISQLIKRSQRLNANYAINTANRVKYKSPLRKRGWSPNSRKSEPGVNGPHSDAGLSDDQDCADVDDGSSNGSAGSYTNAPFSKPSLRSRPANILPLSTSLKRFEVTSANLKKWIEEQDLEALEGAVLEGHGERVRNKVEILDTKADTLQNYLEETFPKIMNKIRVIHAAVSCGDINGLQSHLDKNDYALAKDHLGMAPLHKAVILGHIDVVHFILEKFPETINARDREGRTALHYAAATTNRNGAKIYKILLRAGADPRVRDSNNKTAEYYKVHLLPLPSELSRLSVNSKRKQTLNGVGLSPITKRRQILLPSIQEKITNALHDGDATQLKELVLEGYGDAILGRSSWGEEARKFLRNLPHFMDSIKSLQASIVNGDLSNCERILQNDNYLRAKDENGLLPIHLAVNGNQREIVEFMLTKYPNLVNVKDNYGRTPLHIAAQNKYNELYKKIVELGGDPKILDMKGRTADHYFKVQFYNDFRSMNHFTSKPQKNSANSQITDSSAVETVDTENTEKYENDFEKESDAEEVTADTKAAEKINKERDSGVGTADRKPIIDVLNTSTEVDKSLKETEISDGKDAQVINDDVNVSQPDISTGNKVEETTESETKHVELINNEVNVEIRNNEINNIECKTENKNEKVEESVEEESKSKVRNENASECETNTVNSKAMARKKLTKQRTKTMSQKKMSQSNVKKQLSTIKSSSVDRKPLTRNTSLPTMNPSKTATKAQTKTKVESLRGKVNNKSMESYKSDSDDKANVEAHTFESARIVAEKLLNSCSLEEINNDTNKTLTDEKSSNNNGVDTENEAKAEQQQIVRSETLSGETSGKQSVDTVIENFKDLANTISVEQSSDTTQKENEENNDKSVIEQKTVELEENTVNEEYADDFETDDHENEDTVKSELKSEESDNPAGENTNSEEAKVVLHTVEESTDELSEKQIKQSDADTKEATFDNENHDEDNPEINETNEISEINTKKHDTDADVVEPQESSSKLELIDEIKKESETENNQDLTSDSLNQGVNENIEDAVAAEALEEITTANESSELKTSDDIQHSLTEDSSQNQEQTKSEAEHEHELNDDSVKENSNTEEPNTEQPEEHDVGEINDNNVAPDSTNNDDTNEEEKQPETENQAQQEEAEENEEKKIEEENENGELGEVSNGEASITKNDTDSIKEDNNENQMKGQEEQIVESNATLLNSESTNEMRDETLEDEHEPTKSSKVEETKYESENIDETDQTETEDVKDEKVSISTSERRKSELSVRSDEKHSEIEEKISSKENECDQNSVQSIEDGRQSEIGKRVMNVDDRLNELIEKWFREGDLLRLEHVVIAGQGERLIGRKSDDKQVQEFIDLVPAYMVKIRNVHETVVRGNFNEVRHVLTRKRFALSRDQFGASPLHLAVLHGHMDVLVYIITQFPETIDGPDNEGRTALHYAAVIGEEDIQYYEILKKAGAKDNILDKMGNTANFYLQNPGVLTIRELLENYKQEPGSAKREPEQVDVWRRPPTADIESQLTPSSSGSPENRVGSAESQRRRRHKREVSAVVHVDAEAQEADTKEDENTKEEIESLSSQFEEALKEEKERLQENFDKEMRNASSHGPESLNGDANGTLSIGSIESDSEFNLCQVKNEKGQTILHLAASKLQKRAVLYKMLSQAEYLIPERDVKYRTIRDIAIDKQLKQNVVTIDAYVLDAFVKGNIRFVQKLSHEGYDLHNIVDADGNDVTSVLRRQNITSMITLLEDISYFQKSKNELHTFIKNDYTEGVRDKVESDPTLITAKNRRGRCALHIAVLFPNVEVVECLVTVNPSSVNIQDNLGRTALHYAMANSRVEEMAKILVAAGANRVIRDVQMRTPSYYFVYKDEIKEIRREEQALE